MCSDASASFSLCSWRNSSLVEGAAEVTSRREIPQEVMRELQEGAAWWPQAQVTGGSRGSQSSFCCSRAHPAEPGAVQQAESEFSSRLESVFSPRHHL